MITDLYITISRKEYDRLQEDSETLNQAYAAGVDNWDGWMSWIDEDEEEDDDE